MIILYPIIVEGFDVFSTILQCDIPHFAEVSSDIRVDTEAAVNAPYFNGRGTRRANSLYKLKALEFHTGGVI